jgi:hypothetical protein
MRTILACLVFSALTVSCVSCGDNNGPSNRPAPDPVNCASACTKLKDLKCPEGDDIFVPDQGAEAGVDAGTLTTCTQFCEETQNKGHSLNAGCVMKITKCDEMKTCESW